MNNKIKTYTDLLEEKKRLQELLLVQKNTLKNNVAELKTELKPALSIFNFFKQITSNHKEYYIINSITNWTKEHIFSSEWLKKNNWFIQFIIPLILKNIASYFFTKKANNT
ncbi:MAG: hypothetical protein JSR09_05070 [Bacteroidetes bacterium]|nr:hypothetical protein [Bacteroidota bacterium]MBS1649057.1 hypothetical protein [Bacteroidota bacterium]